MAVKPARGCKLRTIDRPNCVRSSYRSPPLGLAVSIRVVHGSPAWLRDLAVLEHARRRPTRSPDGVSLQYGLASAASVERPRKRKFCIRGKASEVKSSEVKSSQVKSTNATTSLPSSVLRCCPQPHLCSYFLLSTHYGLQDLARQAELSAGYRPG